MHTENLLANAGFPEYGFLKGNLHRLTIDMEAVESDCNGWLEKGAIIKGKEFTEVRKEQYLRKAAAINNDHINFSIKLSGKVLTPLVNIPKVTRPRLVLKDYDGILLQSDVSSTHILLSLPFMRKYRAQLTSWAGKNEMSKVEEMVATKSFYKVLSQELRAEGVNVIDEKEDFLRKVCNSVNHHPNLYKTAFERLYPNFSAFIKDIRKEKSFTAVMNPIEAKLFNNMIAHRVYKELGSQTFLAGIFDAFIYKEENRQDIELIMDEEVYKMTGLKGMVKTNTLAQEAEKAIVYPSKVENSLQGDAVSIPVVYPEGKPTPVIMQVVKDVAQSKPKIIVPTRQLGKVDAQQETKVIPLDNTDRDGEGNSDSFDSMTLEEFMRVFNSL